MNPKEPTRARYPDAEGYVERDGVRVFYEAYGEGEPAIFFLPTWAIAHSRLWKGQVPYFSRHTRVLTLDPRGNGRSDRPTDPAAHGDREVLADAIAVMDATETDRAIVVGLSDGGWFASVLAALHPDRVAGAVLIGTATPLGEAHAHRADLPFDEVLDTEEGWRGKWNRHYWLRDYRGFLEWFAAQIFNDPHSTKQREDFVGWGLETTPETLLTTMEAPMWPDSDEGEPPAWRSDEMRERAIELYGRIAGPVLVIHGDSDVCDPYSGGVEVATATGGRFVSLAGCGHVPVGRYPVRVNLLIREFLESVRGLDAKPRKGSASLTGGGG
jgi:pimeloyl-ACP methyl ester carboxylesterase